VIEDWDLKEVRIEEHGVRDHVAEWLIIGA
jgi:hypothetical protein